VKITRTRHVVIASPTGAWLRKRRTAYNDATGDLRASRLAIPLDIREQVT
jgi:hypothetical protein